MGRGGRRCEANEWTGSPSAHLHFVEFEEINGGQYGLPQRMSLFGHERHVDKRRWGVGNIQTFAMQEISVVIG